MSDKDKEKSEQETEEEESRTDAEQSSEQEDKSEGLTVEELAAQLAEAKKKLAAANKEAKDRRIALEALQKEKKDRDEAELSEAQKAAKRAEEAEARAQELEKKNRSLSIRTKAQSTARDLKLSFVNSKAEEDALRLLEETEDLGDDLSGLEEALKTVSRERPYLFGKPIENSPPPTDGSSKGRSNKAALDKEAINKKRSQIRPL